jgi:hypothetical protein
MSNLPAALRNFDNCVLDNEGALKFSHVGASINLSQASEGSTRTTASQDSPLEDDRLMESTSQCDVGLPGGAPLSASTRDGLI